MKILFYHSLATIILLLTITACNKDVTEAELLKNQLATADSLLKRGGVIKYSVKVISTCNSVILKAKMDVSNAQVTIYQNDSTYTAYTDADGLAIFPNMRVGTAAVNVKLKDHATVDYIADLTPADNLVNLSQSQIINTVRYASTMVPMFPIADPGAATITGKVTAELDLTNTTPEPAPGVTVTAMVDVTDSSFVETYIKPTEGSSTSQNAGRILKFAFQDAVVSTLTDDKGIYTLKVPAALNGLPIKLSVQDYQATQKLYLENDPETGEFKPNKYSIPILFSKNEKSSSIPVVNPIYLTLEEPTIPIGITYSSAILGIEVDAIGAVTKVNVISTGNYSTKPTIVVLDYNGSKDALLDPIFNETTGAIDGVNIINGGQGYSTTKKHFYAVLTQRKEKAIITPIIDNAGYISNFTLNNKGYGYGKVPNISFISPFNNTVYPTINLTMNYVNGGYIESIKVLKEGYLTNTKTNLPESSTDCNNTTIKVNTINNNSYIKSFYLGTGTIL